MSNIGLKTVDNTGQNKVVRDPHAFQPRPSLIQPTALPSYTPVNIRDISRYNVIQAVAALEKTCDYLEVVVGSVQKQVTDLAENVGAVSDETVKLIDDKLKTVTTTLETTTQNVAQLNTSVEQLKEQMTGKYLTYDDIATVDGIDAGKQPIEIYHIEDDGLRWDTLTGYDSLAALKDVFKNNEVYINVMLLTSDVSTDVLTLTIKSKFKYITDEYEYEDIFSIQSTDNLTYKQLLAQHGITEETRPDIFADDIISYVSDMDITFSIIYEPFDENDPIKFYLLINPVFEHSTDIVINECYIVSGNVEQQTANILDMNVANKMLASNNDKERIISDKKYLLKSDKAVTIDIHNVSVYCESIIHDGKKYAFLRDTLINIMNMFKTHIMTVTCELTLDKTCIFKQACTLRFTADYVYSPKNKSTVEDEFLIVTNDNICYKDVFANACIPYDVYTKLFNEKLLQSNIELKIVDTKDTLVNKDLSRNIIIKTTLFDDIPEFGAIISVSPYFEDKSKLASITNVESLILKSHVDNQYLSHDDVAKEETENTTIYFDHLQDGSYTYNKILIPDGCTNYEFKDLLSNTDLQLDVTLKAYVNTGNDYPNDTQLINMPFKGVFRYKPDKDVEDEGVCIFESVDTIYKTIFDKHNISPDIYSRDMNDACDKRVRVLLVEVDNELYFVDDGIDVSCNELIITRKYYNDTSLTTVAVTNELINKNNKLLDCQYLNRSEIARRSLIETRINIHHVTIGSDTYTFLSGYSSIHELANVFKNDSVYIQFSTTTDELLSRTITLDYTGFYRYTNKYDFDRDGCFIIEHQDKKFIDVLREAGVSEEEILTLDEFDELFELNVITMVGFNPLDDENSHLFYLYPPLGGGYANIRECIIPRYDYNDLAAIPNINAINNIVTAHTENEQYLCDGKYLSKDLVEKYHTHNRIPNFIDHTYDDPTFILIKRPIRGQLKLKLINITFDGEKFDQPFTFSGMFTLSGINLDVISADDEISEYCTYKYFRQHFKNENPTTSLPDDECQISLILSVATNGNYTIREAYTNITCSSIQQIESYIREVDDNCVINGDIYTTDMDLIQNTLQNVIRYSDMKYMYTKVISASTYNMQYEYNMLTMRFDALIDVQKILRDRRFKIHIKCYFEDDIDTLYENTFTNRISYIYSDFIFTAFDDKANHINMNMYDQHGSLTVASITIDDIDHTIVKCDVFEILVDDNYYFDKPASIKWCLDTFSSKEDNNIPDDYEVPSKMIMLQSNENKNILIPCSKTDYVDISSLPDSLEKLFNVDKVYGYESDVAGKLKIKQCRKIAIITSGNGFGFTHKHVEYDKFDKTLTLLPYNNSHYPTSIQNIIYNNSLITFNTIKFSNDITNCIFDKSFEFYMDDTCKLNVNDSKLKHLTCTGIDVSNMTTMYQMFYKCTSLISLDLSNWDTSHVIDMGGMFLGCSVLISLNISNWNTSNVISMGNMFFKCYSLTSLDLSNWNTGNVNDMSNMFYECISLISLDASNWNTSNVSDMSGMFYECTSLASLYLLSWKTGNVKNMSEMFYRCRILSTLQISSWDTSNVTDMMNMFAECHALITLYALYWNTSNVTNMSGMFYECTSLASLHIANWDISKVTDIQFMFNECTSLILINMNTETYNKIKTSISGTWIRTNTGAYAKIDNNYVLASEFNSLKSRVEALENA